LIKNKKQISIFILVMMMFSIMPFQAFAEESIPTSGTCGENLTWKLEDNVLTISGAGEIADYTDVEQPWGQTLLNVYYSGAEVKVVIEEGVTGIGAYAFGSLDAIHSVELPDSLVTIGDSAFAWADNLSAVTIPENVDYIGAAAFAGTGITSVVIPDNQVQIMERAFSQCTNLEKLIIPSSATVGADFINSTPKLKTAGPIGGDYNFEFGWTDIIPAYAFQECRDLESVVLPDTITSIGEDAFYGCSSLQAIELSQSLEEIQGRAFCGCYSLETVEIPNGVKEIGPFAFSACSSLSSISLPDSLESLGEGAVNACGLISIVIPNGVKEIASDTFRYCEKLKEISLGSGIESIGETAFWGCSALSGIDIPYGTKSIGERAFRECSSLTQVSLPVTLETIGAEAFLDCRSLTEVTIPNGVTKLNYKTFNGCSSLTKAVLPASLEAISGAQTFRDCPLLTAIYFYGDAPEVEPADDDYYASFDADTAVLYYLEGKDGWTSPTWNGYQTAVWEGGEYPEQPNIPSIPDEEEPDNPLIPDEEEPPVIAETVIVGTNPVNGADNVGYDASDLPDFYIQFNKVPATMNGAAVQIDASKEPFAIYRASDDTLIWEDPSARLNNEFSTKMVISSDGTIVAVTPTNAHVLLEKNTEYYITMGEGYIKFEDGSVSPAIEKGDWCFKTKNPDVTIIKDITIANGPGLKDAVVSVVWKDSWFDNSSNYYMHDLATASMALSAASYVNINGKPASNKIQEAFETLGFHDIQSFNYEVEREKLDNDIVSYNFAAKSVEDNGTVYTLVAVVIKGTSGDEEWYSNFNVGQGNRHQGFGICADDVMLNLETYVEELGLDSSNTKFLITGHSRGAAVANLVAKEVTNSDLAQVRNVYGYTFATPTVAMDNTASNYDNIFNILNGEDFVTKVPLTNWNYKRYGIDLLLPSKSYYGEGFGDIYSEMIGQYYHLTETVFEPYNGTQKVDKLVNDVFKIAPNVKQFYENENWEGLTPYQYFYSLAYSIVTNDIGPLGVASASEYAPITLFFVENHKLHSRVFSAHSMAAYYSWMSSCNEEELFGNTNTKTNYWFKRAIIACPVDVYVYDEVGALVASIVDEVIDHDGLAVSVEDGVKTIDLPTDQEYSIKISARDNGTVSYTVDEYETSADSMEILRTVKFNNIPIEVGDELTTAITNEETEEYVVVKNASATLNPDYDSDAPEEIITIGGGGGHSAAKAEVIVPENALPTDVTVTTDYIDYDTLNDVKDFVSKDDNVTVIGGRNSGAQIVVKPSNAVEDFTYPVTLVVPVSSTALKDVDDVNKLTLALITEDDQENIQLTYVGGNYDAFKNTFSAYVKQPGKYVLVEKQDIVKLELGIDRYVILVNGEPIINDVSSRIVNSRTLVPAARVMHHLGCRVEWINDIRTVVVTLPSGEILTMPVDEPIPGFGVSPMIENGRTLVPMAYVADMMDAHVLWVGDSRQVIIVK